MQASSSCHPESLGSARPEGLKGVCGLCICLRGDGLRCLTVTSSTRDVCLRVLGNLLCLEDKAFFPFHSGQKMMI